MIMLEEVTNQELGLALSTQDEAQEESVVNAPKECMDEIHDKKAFLRQISRTEEKHCIAH